MPHVSEMSPTGTSPARPVLIALGSNLGDRAAHFNEAVRLLSENSHVNDLTVSAPLVTQPVGGPAGQDEFLNGAACFWTGLSPAALFARLKEIERQVGRQQRERWGPRAIDLDLLLYDEEVIAEDVDGELTVPHPRMAFRRFVLQPAAEIAPQMLHPIIGWTIAELLDHLRNWPSYVTIASVDRARATELARQVVAATGGTVLSQSNVDLGPPDEKITGDNRGSDDWQAQAAQYFAHCNRLLPAFDAWKPHDLRIANFHPAEILWHAPPELDEPALEALRQIPRRPKLCVNDGRPVPGYQGPSLDIQEMTDDEAVIEIVAAIEAMRE